MSKAISRRDFMKVTGVVGAAGLPDATEEEAAILPALQPLLPWHPLPLLPQTRAWPCLTVLFP